MSGGVFFLGLPFEVEGYAKSENYGGDAEQRQAGNVIGLQDDNLSGHRKSVLLPGLSGPEPSRF